MISIIIFTTSCVLGHGDSFAFWKDDLTYEGESIYNYLQVYEDDSKVVFSTNVLFGVQSVYRKEKTLTGMYYDYAMAAPFMAGVGEKEDLNVLILGMGTGTFATQCNRYFTNVNVEGVEIDERITDLAHEYFELPNDIKVTTYDGRAYLHGLDREQKYDVIMVDAYQDITIPFQMASIEFFQLVKEHLTDDGVMVVNMNMISDGDDGINSYLADTISRVFPTVYTADVYNGTNRELYASCNTDIIERFEIGYSLEEEGSLRNMMDRVDGALTAYEAGDHLLTDDKAPVELLSMKAIDAIISKEVDYYKQIYDEKGLEGVIDKF